MGKLPTGILFNDAGDNRSLCVRVYAPQNHLNRFRRQNIRVAKDLKVKVEQELERVKMTTAIMLLPHGEGIFNDALNFF